MNSTILPKKRTMLLYMLPGFVLYTLAVVAPIFIALYYGFFEWSGGTKKTFIGMQNFAELFHDKVFIESIGHNLFITIICIVGQIGIAFIFAFLLNSRGIWLKGVHRSLMYFPSVLSAVVVGFIWSLIYDYHYGLLNTLLRAVGLESHVQSWLNNEGLALPLVSIPLVWQYIGYYMIILLSAFSAIDPSVFEMAEIDGATGWRKAVYITIPMIKNTLLVCITLCIAGNMKIFDNIYVMTGGGPGTATTVMAMHAYKTSFLKFQMGYASAMSIAILLISLVLIGGSRVLIGRLTREQEV